MFRSLLTFSFSLKVVVHLHLHLSSSCPLAHYFTRVVVLGGLQSFLVSCFLLSLCFLSFIFLSSLAVLIHCLTLLSHMADVMSMTRRYPDFVDSRLLDVSVTVCWHQCDLFAQF